MYDAALGQCEQLQDRVALFHVKEDDPNGGDFRSGTGINNLKYGMTYTPWLDVNFPKNITYRAFKDHIQKGATQVNLTSLTNEPLATTGREIIKDIEMVNAATIALAEPQKTLQEKFTVLKSKELTATNFMALVNWIFELARRIDILIGDSEYAITNIGLKNKLSSLITSTIKGNYSTLITYDRELGAEIETYTEQYKLAGANTPVPSATEWEGMFIDATPPDPSDIMPSGADDVEAMKSMLPKIQDLFNQINNSWLVDIVGAAHKLGGQIPITVLLTAYEQIIQGVDTIRDASIDLASSQTTLREKFTLLESSYQKEKTAAKFMELVNWLFDIARKVDELAGDGEKSIRNTELKNDLKSLITSTLKGTYTTLISYDRELNDDAEEYTERYKNFIPAATEWGKIFAVNDAPAATTIIPDGTNDVDAMDSMLQLIRTLFDQINNTWLGSIVGAAQELEKKKHEGLLESFPLYKTIITGIQNTSSSVPPSGAVAGIYAYVDRTRGVWKAPANVSISGIVGPKETFTASELDALNMDADSGKSINAIRHFTGKGTLVFGARTLAGNDNEWRYVSVRRFFNFAEESIKKATEQFVFEPNDANTWVRVQAMIENFLTTLWRQGALQGIKPEHAFYVAVGLGKTMTAVDIVEGRMIIEIGMAAVRPAEFIILRFSHKMAES